MMLLCPERNKCAGRRICGHVRPHRANRPYRADCRSVPCPLGRRHLAQEVFCKPQETRHHAVET